MNNNSKQKEKKYCSCKCAQTESVILNYYLFTFFPIYPFIISNVFNFEFFNFKFSFLAYINIGMKEKITSLFFLVYFIMFHFFSVLFVFDSMYTHTYTHTQLTSNIYIPLVSFETNSSFCRDVSLCRYIHISLIRIEASSLFFLSFFFLAKTKSICEYACVWKFAVWIVVRKKKDEKKRAKIIIEKKDVRFLFVFHWNFLYAWLHGGEIFDIDFFSFCCTQYFD